MNKPTVYWITGLSGAGKTTIGNEVYNRLKQQNPAVVLFDGDLLREVFGHDLGYSIEDRYKSAMRFSRLCRMMSTQGISVVCCTISMFDNVREWNRNNIPGYFEAYLNVPLNVLKARDKKGLYSGIKSKSVSDVVGLDIKMEEPKNPDIILINDGSLSVSECAEAILKKGKN